MFCSFKLSDRIDGSFFLAVMRGRERRGFPGWDLVSERLDLEVVTDYPDDVEVKYPRIKNPEVQRLHNYEEIPD